MGFVIAVEKDEWTIKQCAHVVMFNIYWSVYDYIMGMFTGGLNAIPFVGGVIAAPLNIIDTIVWVVLVVLVMIQGLGKLKNGQDISLPGKLNLKKDTFCAIIHSYSMNDCQKEDAHGAE